MDEKEWLTATWRHSSGRLPEKLHQLLDQTALKERRSKTYIMARIIAAYYKDKDLAS